MENQLGNEFLSNLANLLKGIQVESGVVTQALELICVAGGFDCGGVYELDAAVQFCLMEQYAPQGTTLCPSFPALEHMPKDGKYPELKAVYCVTRGPNMTPAEKALLDRYGAETLALAMVWDENWNTYGFIALLNTSCRSSEADVEALAAPMSMLARYVGVRMYKRKLDQAQLALESILDNTGIDIYVNDFNTHEILYVNKTMAAPYGGREKFVGQKCWAVLFPGQNGPCEFCPQCKLIDDQGMPTKVYTWDYQRAFDGSWFRVFSAAFRWVDGRLAHVVSSADITDNKIKEKLIENLANYDQLTKLPNRRMLLEECARRIKNATETEQGYILFFDIDGFKAINDTYGHDAGDEFLIQLGEFFASIPMLKNSIYRNGGDEFVAVLGGEGITKANIQSLAHFIHGRFQNPWKLKRGEVWCNTSIGVACYPEDGRTGDDLLQKADMAMYLAKKSGGGKMSFAYELKASRDNGENEPEHS